MNSGSFFVEKIEDNYVVEKCEYVVINVI